jgi:hippurate hydrolase
MREGVQPMALINRIAGFAEEMATWRQALHRRPELGFACHETAAFVVERLREFGITRIEDGIAESGIVAVIEGQGAGPVIGLRADMDALPIQEASGAPHASEMEGCMHACGHDGHTTMLLGAAKYLAETRNFAGSVALIFQPAEEGPGGAVPMVEAGIMERYGIEQVYAIHCAPGHDEGVFYTTPGPIMAAVDTIHIDVIGQGGHAAMPQECRDAVVAACGMVQAIQTILSRNLAALDQAVVSITQIHTGSADNVVPDRAYINGTVRSFDPQVRRVILQRLEEVVAGQAASYGVTAELRCEEGYAPTVNDAGKAAFAAKVAREVSVDVVDDMDRQMGSEDFAAMLEARPGAYLFLGQGPGAGLHHPEFDFNDRIAPIGASFFARLVERAQPVG